MATTSETLQLAITHEREGRWGEAETAYREILAREPANVEALNNLGNVLGHAQRFPEAIACFEEALRLRPELAALHFNFGNLLRAAGAPDRAVPCYRRASELDGGFAAAYKNLAVVQQALGDFTAAAQSLGAAIRIDPADAEAHYNLGLLHYSQRNLDAASAGYVAAIELRPDLAVAHYNLGIVRVAQHDFAAARDCFREALRIRPNYCQPLVHLGLLEMAHGEDAAALEFFDEALRIDPQSAAHANRGAVLLARGDYAAGWPEYAWSRKCSASAVPKDVVPSWEGEPLAGRAILVHGYHGLGDTLQFVRFMPELRRRGAGRILLSVRDEVRPLVSDGGFGEVFGPADALPRCDVAVSLLDIPSILQPTDETIPPAPYLRVEQEFVDRWRAALGPHDGLRVGIAWQGNREYPWDHLRSIPLVEFAPLAAVEGVRLISLQKGDGREQVAALSGCFEVTELPNSEERSLVDTAAVIKCLDLVICSDSAIAHLAGALGANVWVALLRGADWRWQRTREDSPWYPSMRLFRQRAVGNWSEVFEAMAVELRELAGRGAR